MLYMVVPSILQCSKHRSVGAQELGIGRLLHEPATRGPDAVVLIAGALDLGHLELL